MKGQMNQIMRQAQKMQAKMAKVMEELKLRTVSGESGGGMVVAEVNGSMRLIGLKIEDEVMNDGDSDMLKDLIAAAVNAALDNMEKIKETEMAKVSGGLQIPGMF